MLHVLLLVLVLCCSNVSAYIVSSSDDGVPSPENGLDVSQAINDSSIEPSATKEDFMTGIFSAFSVIAVSEIGDKTFFIAVVLSLANPPVYVYAGALAALALMTMLSAGLGLVFSIMSTMWVQYLSAVLFLLFGLKMFKEGFSMKSDAGKEELEEVQKSIENKMSAKEKLGMDVEAGTMRVAIRWVFLEAFTMTFLSEWGDRSQIATVILAAKHNVIGVVLGSTLGHAACTLLAVAGGKLVADHISIRTVTIFGALLFIAFAFSSFIGAMNESLPATVS